MATEKFEIDNYKLGWNKAGGPQIRIHLVENDEWSPIISVPGDEAEFVVGMLRNEKPVYWYPEQKWIATGSEMVGEEEG